MENKSILTIYKYKSKYGGVNYAIDEGVVCEEDRQAKIARYMKEYGDVVIAITEVEVDFVDFSEDQVRQNEIGAVKSLIEKVKEKAIAEIKPLEDKLQELLSITADIGKNSVVLSETINNEEIL